MKLAPRFGRFLARFWPLWLPLFLLFALPFSRPFGRIVSDELVEGIRYEITGEQTFDAMPAATLHPADFDLQLWHRWNKQRRNYRYYYDGTDAADQKEIAELRRRFPAEPLLIVPPLQHQLGLSSSEFPWYDYAPPGRSKAEIAAELKQLRDAVIAGRKLEPNNAFWWVSLAQIEWRSNNYDATLRALEKAANCAYYDDHTLALARRLARARARYDEPSFFDKLAIMQDARGSDGNKQSAMGQVWSAHAARVRAKGDVARALRWCGALIRVGDLMQRDPNARATLRAGAQWQGAAYLAVYPNSAKKNLDKRATYFANFARKNGRPDLARQVPAVEARGRAVKALQGEVTARYDDLIWLNVGRFDKIIALLQALPFAMASILAYLASWWLGANFLTWRARGAPSARRDRVGLALVTTMAIAALGGLGVWFVANSAGGINSMAEIMMASAGIFAFFGAPFVLALLCAVLTMRRHRSSFALPPRIDMELALSLWQRGFLRWFLPLCVASSVGLCVGGWVLFMVANWRKWGNVDLFKLLPPDRNGVTGSLPWDSTGVPLPLLYGAFLCWLSLIIWFGRWRWTVPMSVRPHTQGALRWWKESIGTVIVLLAWFSLVLALVSWPLLRAADARLERALNKGELAVVRELRGTSAKTRIR